MTGAKFHRWLCAALCAVALAIPHVARAQSGGPNLLKNPGFDWPAQTNGDVCAPGWAKDNAITPHEWVAFWTCKSGEELNQDLINRAPEFRVMTVDIAADRVRSYPTSASFFTYRSINRSAGLYQIVRGVTPGARLRFSVWVNLLTTNSDVLPLSSSRQPGGLQARVCIHTTGAVFIVPNLNDPAVTCGAWVRPYDTWGEAVVEATAASDTVAVIIDTTAEYPVIHNDVHVDDASLTVVGGAPAAQQPSSAQPSAAPAATIPGVVVKTPTANVRAAPSFNGAILASAPQGTTFTVRAYTADRQWWQIEFKGAPGGLAFIHNSVVTPNAAAQAALGGNAATAQQPATAQTIAGAPAQVVVNTGGGRLNVRAAPAANAPILGRIQNGASLEVKGISPDKQWWRIAYAGGADGTAWVMAQYVVPNAAAKQLAGLP
ncbi:MAG: SH3 domain-containing protein [Anaerolineae bacterium]|nr:SH3 domain-containing protein [Candidatus Roseilinea sp.]MDW8449416.1 SH3 domain-containing protein [Anaerolineae bacterium]